MTKSISTIVTVMMPVCLLGCSGVSTTNIGGPPVVASRTEQDRTRESEDALLTNCEVRNYRPDPLAAEATAVLDDTSCASAEGRMASAWRVRLTAGYEYEVSVRSATFHPNVWVQRVGKVAATDALVQSDRIVSGSTVRLAFRCVQTGEYLIVITSRDPRKRGTFFMSVESSDANGPSVVMPDTEQSDPSDGVIDEKAKLREQLAGLDREIDRLGQQWLRKMRAFTEATNDGHVQSSSTYLDEVRSLDRKLYELKRFRRDLRDRIDTPVLPRL